MTTTYILGKDAKLYRNTGTYGTPTYAEVENVQDLNLNVSTSEGDVTTRGNASSGFRAKIPVLSDGEISFKMIYDQSDADFTAIQTAFQNKSTIEFFVLDGATGTSGTKGLRATCCVFNFSQAQPLENAITVDVVLKPTYATYAPSWVTFPLA